jgi:antirestriction protein ArdC
MKTSFRKSAYVKTDIAAEITQKILARLEAGTKPWVQPWTGNAVSRPLRHCGTAYRGINTLLLWMTAEERGYTSPTWMTYRQAELLGGQVRKGEKCSHAVFYKVIAPGEPASTDEIEGYEDGGKVRRLLRFFAVFNADQIDGLPIRYLPVLNETRQIPESIHRPQLEALFARIPAIVRHNGTRAYYHIARDEIVLPPVDQFTSYEAYASVRNHETAHWSGAEKRLNRTFGKRFGDSGYAMEEMVADMSAAILGAAMGLPEAQLDNHAAYLATWIKVLRADKNAILTAASKADEAADFILGFFQPGLTRIIEREPQLLAA